MDVLEPTQLVLEARAAVEAAARVADIAAGGPYRRDDTLTLRRADTLATLAKASPVAHRRQLRHLRLFDRACHPRR